MRSLSESDICYYIDSFMNANSHFYFSTDIDAFMVMLDFYSKHTSILRMQLKTYLLATV